MSIEVQPGWFKAKKTSLEGDFPEFQYIRQPEKMGLPAEFRVVADHRGVRMKGTSPFLVNPDDYDNFAWVLGDASREHLRMKRSKLEVVGDNELREINKTL
jgi:hypothetical protein